MLIRFFSFLHNVSISFEEKALVGNIGLDYSKNIYPHIKDLVHPKNVFSYLTAVIAINTVRFVFTLLKRS